MAKIAVIVSSDTVTVEAIGKVSNALLLATEAAEQGDELKFIFEGAGTKWIGELEKPEHKMHPGYAAIKDRITGACQYCSHAFGVANQVKQANLPFIAEYKDHPSIRTLVQEGYEVITY